MTNAIVDAMVVNHNNANGNVGNPGSLDSDAQPQDEQDDIQVED